MEGLICFFELKSSKSAVNRLLISRIIFIEALRVLNLTWTFSFGISRGYYLEYWSAGLEIVFNKYI